MSPADRQISARFVDTTGQTSATHKAVIDPSCIVGFILTVSLPF